MTAHAVPADSKPRFALFPRRNVRETPSDRLVSRLAWGAVSMSLLSLLLLPWTTG